MRKIGIMLIGLLALSGCSSKFAYNNIDWLVYWYVDDYVELTNEQEDAFDAKVDRWLKWHRGEELQQYALHLQQIKKMATTTEITAEEIAEEFALGRTHWERLRSELSPGLAQMAISLSDEQVVYFFAQLEKENKEEEEERREELEEKSEQEILDDRVERVTEQVEEFIGKTNSSQRRLIRDFAPQFQSTYEYWLSYRRDVQQKARELFATRENNPTFVEELTTLISNPDVYRSEEHIRLGEENALLYATMLSELQGTLTDKQKRRLNREVDGIIEDIEDLMDA